MLRLGMKYSCDKWNNNKNLYVSDVCCRRVNDLIGSLYISEVIKCGD